MTKTKGNIITPTATGFSKDTENLVKRVKKELLWILISSIVALGLGLVAGNLIKL